MVTILIAYAAGVPEILDVCLSALQRHKPGVPISRVKVVTDAHGQIEAAEVACRHMELPVEVCAYNVGFVEADSEMHGKLLDMGVQDSETEFVLTLDSDCFPVADDWLCYLVGWIRDGATVSGILWPWVPAPYDLDERTIEYRIRKYHCYRCTQVACQLIRRDYLLKNNLSFVGKTDTGFGIIDKVWEQKGVVAGFMPTRCPVPKGDLDPEMNRMCAVVYGDMVYHHGGGTRSVTVGNIDPQKYFDEAKARVIQEKGAEWLLDPKNGYRYKLDKEEAVAQFKMEGMYAAMRDYLLTHNRLFEL